MPDSRGRPLRGPDFTAIKCSLEFVKNCAIIGSELATLPLRNRFNLFTQWHVTFPSTRRVRGALRVIEHESSPVPELTAVGSSHQVIPSLPSLLSLDRDSTR